MSTPKPTPPSDLLNAYLAGADAARSSAPGLPLEPPPVVPPAAPPPAPPRRPPLAWIAAGVLALACAGLAGALLAGRGEDEPPPHVVAVAPATPPAYTPTSTPEPDPLPAARPAPAAPVAVTAAEAAAVEVDVVDDESQMYLYDTPSLPSGTWFVVLGGARGTPDARMLRVEEELRGNGVNVQRIVSDAYPGLNPGLVVLVEGPTTQAMARQRLRLLKDLVPDAYVKSGW